MATNRKRLRDRNRAKKKRRMLRRWTAALKRCLPLMSPFGGLPAELAFWRAARRVECMQEPE